jgi:hypothetical protein
VASAVPAAAAAGKPDAARIAGLMLMPAMPFNASTLDISKLGLLIGVK